VLDEIFRQAIYPLDGVGDPGTIVDLGSHVGASILFFRRRFPDARIVGFEPDPANFRKLSRNVGHLSGVELHNIAIAAADGPVEFYESGAYDGWASSLTRSTPWQRPVQVEGRTLESALAACGIERIDLLKIDVEGAEYAILGGYRNLGAVAHVIGEVHAPRSASDLDGLRARLSGHEHDLPSALPEGSTAFRASLRG
jgi:FkbM family methyltransferase